MADVSQWHFKSRISLAALLKSLSDPRAVYPFFCGPGYTPATTATLFGCCPVGSPCYFPTGCSEGFLMKTVTEPVTMTKTTDKVAW